MAEPSPGLESPAIADGLTEDKWLGGRLSLLQPRRGHRVGTDAALLAAAAGARQGRIVDVGAGVGAVGLALAKRAESVSVDLVEIDPGLAALAERNAALNGLQARARVLRLDALVPKERREAGLAQANCVVTNPPFFEPEAVRVSPDEGKARAHVFARTPAGAGLADWISASLAILAPGGRFVMIHRPEAVSVILAALENRTRRDGALPVHPAHWRECASSARLGGERLEGAAQHRAGAHSARLRWAADRRGGRASSRRAADRLGRLGSAP